MALVLVTIVVVGGLAIRAVTTLTTVQSVNIPTSTVSGEALGGDSTVAIDTSAAREATGAENDNDGIWDHFRNAASGVSDLAGGAAVAGGLEDPPTGTMNVLLMGVDARPGEPIDVNVRPDAIAILHLDPTSGACRLLAIPRDTRANLPGYGMTKVNHALAVGGIPFQRQVVEELLEIRLDHYGLIDFNGLETLVNSVGGVTITVPEAFSAGGVAFATGQQTLDGEEALAYARYRGGSDGDFGRIRRQQQIIGALVRSAAGVNVRQAITDLFPSLKAHVRTDLSPGELAGLALRYRATCTEETIDVNVLQGTVATYDDPLLGQPLSYVVVDPAEIRQKVAELTAP